MSSGVEDDFPFFIAQQVAVRVHAHPVGGGFLEREGDLVFDAEHFFEYFGDFAEACLEQGQVFFGDGEVDLHLFAGAGIEGAFHQVLVESGAHEIPVDVEIDEGFRGVAVVQSLFGEDVFQDFVELPFFNHPFDALAVFPDDVRQAGVERQFVDFEEEVVHAARLFLLHQFQKLLHGSAVAVRKGEQVLEHPAG